MHVYYYVLRICTYTVYIYARSSSEESEENFDPVSWQQERRRIKASLSTATPDKATPLPTLADDSSSHPPPPPLPPPLSQESRPDLHHPAGLGSPSDAVSFPTCVAHSGPASNTGKLYTHVHVHV